MIPKASSGFENCETVGGTRPDLNVLRLNLAEASDVHKL
jgi:hypothetical protein